MPSQVPLEAKLANDALAEDPGVLSRLRSPGYSAAAGGFSRRILAAMLAFAPGPPSPVMMNDVDFTRHTAHSFVAQLHLLAPKGIATVLEFGEEC
jgi:hypothetical protein